MTRIAIHLWYDTQAREAARLYASLFPNSRIKGESNLSDTPPGEVDVVEFELAGTAFQAISAGPIFKFTPAVSLFVVCPGAEDVDRYYAALRPGGGELMELGAYPFSPRYAWISDRYGLSWQLMHSPGASSVSIVPTLLFTRSVCGKAEEALRSYVSILPASSVGRIERYGPGTEPNRPEYVIHSDFVLAGRAFGAMDSALDHDFGFNEAVSIMAICDGQAEIDAYWEALSAHPEAERCGWLKDRYGLSWQIVPARLGELMAEGDPAKRSRLTRAFLAMKKLDIAALERA